MVALSIQFFNALAKYIKTSRPFINLSSHQFMYDSKSKQWMFLQFLDISGKILSCFKGPSDKLQGYFCGNVCALMSEAVCVCMCSVIGHQKQAYAVVLQDHFWWSLLLPFHRHACPSNEVQLRHREKVCRSLRQNTKDQTRDMQASTPFLPHCPPLN